MKLNYGSKIAIALFGILLIGIGVAFNAASALGNDSVGMLYDGVRAFMNLSGEQLGQASNIINFSLIVLLFFIGRRYVNIGTLIYILPYGLFVTVGSNLYLMIVNQELLWARVLAATCGCLVLYTGVAIFIAMDIGLDPFNGLVMTIADRLKWSYRRTKILFDLALIIIGTLLGGTIGVITLITAFVAGPYIQFVADIMKGRLYDGENNH